MTEHDNNVRVPVKATHEVKVIRADGTEGETIQRQLSDEEAQELLGWAEREHPELVAEAKANASEAKAKEEEAQENG